MLRFTLDHNCLIDLHEQRKDAPYVDELIRFHKEGIADVALLAMSASEKLSHNLYAKSYAEFQSRLEEMGISHLSQISPIGYWNVTFWDKCIYPDDAACTLEAKLYDALFPCHERDWAKQAAKAGIDINDPKSKVYHKWRNRLCDVMAIWSHIHHDRDVFVTRDKNFLRSRRETLVSLGAKGILNPRQACELLR